jgi:hypothetical protein
MACNRGRSISVKQAVDPLRTWLPESTLVIGLRRDERACRCALRGDLGRKWFQPRVEQRAARAASAVDDAAGTSIHSAGARISGAMPG